MSFTIPLNLSNHIPCNMQFSCRLWRWRQRISSKRWYPPTIKYGVKTQSTTVSVGQTVKRICVRNKYKIHRFLAVFVFVFVFFFKIELGPLLSSRFTNVKLINFRFKNIKNKFKLHLLHPHFAISPLGFQPFPKLYLHLIF